MSNEKVRTIFLFKDYFTDFYKEQRQKVKDKILWTFRIIETQKLVPEYYLKHLEGTDGLYEIRVLQGSDIFRIFCFFDKGQLIVLANGFHKKTQKTPERELTLAAQRRRDYLNRKTRR